MDDQAFPAEPWKNASPVGIGLSQVPHGAWALARAEPRGPTAVPLPLGEGAQAGSHPEARAPATPAAPTLQ